MENGNQKSSQVNIDSKDASSLASLLTDFELLAPKDKEMLSAFAIRWRSDVLPVHERTENSRAFRTLYIALGVMTAIGLNVGALVAFPFILSALELKAELAMDAVLRAQSYFLFGAALGLLELIFWFITLDADVMRQKRERLAARLRIVTDTIPEMETPLEAFKSKLRKVESFFWSIGVGLAWTNVVLQLASFLLFLWGVASAGRAIALIAG